MNETSNNLEAAPRLMVAGGSPAKTFVPVCADAQAPGNVIKLKGNHPGRRKNQIQKLATVHPLDTGKWAVLVTLVSPRVLEGRMRSGRQKFERQTQALANDLCVEINNVLLNKELARELSPREVGIAKKLFWEILEPKHPEWIEHLDKLVEHCERSAFRLNHGDIPTIAEAARIYWQEYVKTLEKETRLNRRNSLSFLLAAFGELKPFEMTDKMILGLAHGKEPLKTFRTSWEKAETPAETVEHLWDTLVVSKSKRPWSPHMITYFLSSARVFKNWMHASKEPLTQEKRNWCPGSAIELPRKTAAKLNSKADSDSVLDAECKMYPALTIPQVQALLDVAWVAYGGKYAPFYIHALFCGSRVKEITRTGVSAFDSNDGLLAVTASAAKTDRSRKSELYSNAIVMVESLRAAGLYTNEGLRPNVAHRDIIRVLAGFASNSKRSQWRAEIERQRLAEREIILPDHHWGKYPRNGLRRTALSMHYKLFKNESLTVSWGGNSQGIFREFYERLVTNGEARRYWVMLPTWLKNRGDIKVELPPNHKLDSAMTEKVSTAVLAACEANQAHRQDIDSAVAKAKVTRRRAKYLRQKAKKMARTNLQIQSNGCDLVLESSD